MNKFFDTLVSERRHDIIPEEYDYFRFLIGEWSFMWHDNIGSEFESINEGRWTFSRTLEGRAIQDTFVTSKINPINGELEREYGTTIRIYNPQNKNWDVFYGCTGEAVQLVAQKEDDEIVITCLTPVGLKMKWIFFDIKKDTFKWENIRSTDNGITWDIKARAENISRINECC